MNRTFVVDSATVIALVLAIAILFLSESDRLRVAADLTLLVIALAAAARTGWRVVWLRRAQRIAREHGHCQELAIHDLVGFSSVLADIPSGVKTDILLILGEVGESRRRRWATGQRRLL